ncbi:LCP family protein [Trueperella abortisuis]|uniref:LCP family protein required for cell wall assembly n=1 Tax=Trueperella abortisuis TaxID=445930 RepID=A0ABT9PK92_9ACTO|nr:LCP family protein [Trueperella abortisuis]MDP9832877.1 LCP family protein required for cell wall assembly [Trueperella abortisuis]
MGTPNSQSDGTPVKVEYLPPSEKRGVRRAVVAILIILGLLLAFVVASAAWLSAKLDEIQTLADPFVGITELDGVESRPTHDPKQEDKPVNILVLGTDSRVSAGDPSQWQAGAQRTDAFMILQISGDRESMNVLSIPRDSWVDIPGHGQQKINAAFSFGGPTLTIATVEQLTGIPIDHVAVVDFTSFSALTDAVGGVEMTTITDGTKVYNGEEALAFVRERKSLPGGDFDRVRRQQLWMRTVLSSILTRENLTNPVKLMDLYNTISPYVAVDDAVGLRTVLDLGPSLARISSANFNFVTAPNNGTGWSPDRQSIVVLNDGKFKELTQAFVEDRAAEYISENSQYLRTLGSGGIY